MEEDALAALARRHRVRLIVRFGSSVSGHLHAGSDLDLGVILDGDVESYAVRMDLAADLQTLMPEREVDLAILNHADPLFLKQVTDHCDLLYGSAVAFAELKLRAFKQYQDYRPYLALEQAFVDRRLGAAGS
jgi:predicted nucleotidyltransferase